MRAWLQLLRPPNAFTVPGDVVAGFFLAGLARAGHNAARRLAPLVLASLCLYLGGLALNDWFDRDADRRERPDRPIPSGGVSARAALAAGAGLLVLGIGLAALAGTASALLAAGIAGLVLLYDGPARRVAPLGFLVMGLCRGANLLLGATPLFPRIPVSAVAAAAVETLYVTAVTAAAKRETEGPPRRLARHAPLLALAAGMPAVLLLEGPHWLALVAAAVSLVPVSLVVASFSADTPAAAVPPSIGRLLRALVPLQATFVLVAEPDAVLPALAVYALWALGPLASKRFYGS